MLSEFRSPPGRTFSSSDPHEISAEVRWRFGCELHAVAGPGAMFQMERLLATDLVTVDRITSSGLTYTIRPARAWSFLTANRGEVLHHRLGRTDRVRPGESVLVNATDESFVSEWLGDRPICEIVCIDRSVVDELGSGDRTRRIRFTGQRPVSEGAALSWRRTVRHVVSDVLGSPGGESSDLVTRETSRLLAALALTTFPNNAVPREHPATELADPTRGTVERAVSFIDDHADVDITATDIARAASVTPRAVQLAFRREFGTTPMAYLRRLRLARAHQELLKASADEGVTVSEVAAKWGFYNGGRFTQYYREEYGLLPSETLRT